MGLKRLTANEVRARKVEQLGLNPAAVDLTSIEAISGALRRAASFLCPCAASTLVRGVVRPLQGLVDDLTAIKEIVESTLEVMIAHGDIIEQLEVDGSSRFGKMRLLYAAPPSFVSRLSGAAIILGIASDQLSALPEDLERRIEYIAHVRRLTPIAGEDLRIDLIQFGLIELSYNSWLRQPPEEVPAQHIAHFNQVLDSTPPSVDIPGLSLLDPIRPVRYYSGRWVKPTSHSGRFVARRTQVYGADLWCYVEINEGIPVKFVDLPLKNSFWRGCDEGWRLQASIDYERGTPQLFRVRPDPNAACVIDFFSPVPMWARRRWDAVGEPIKSSGCLFSYKFEKDEALEEIDFIEKKLWLAETS